MEFSSEFDFHISYKKSQENIVADALSRLPDYQLNVLSQINLHDNLFADSVKDAYNYDNYFVPM